MYSASIAYLIINVGNLFQLNVQTTSVHMVLCFFKPPVLQTKAVELISLSDI